jgi:perosamine synthetase
VHDRNRLPVSAPDLSAAEACYVSDAIASSWISSTGTYVDRFERMFAEACGTRASVSVANGTAALHLAMLAHGVGAGDEVIVPSLTYIATANAVRYERAEPIFVDIEPTTWCLDPELVEAAITPHTRGIVAVHLYGHPADIDAINDIASRHGLWVVEDAAEAFSATYKDRPAGSLSSAGAFSFYGNKILTSGEGGALTVNDPDLEARIRLLRGQGMDPDRRYFFSEVGYNYRRTNVACAMLCAQLERANQMIQRRRSIFERYRVGLEGVPGIGLQPRAEWAVPAPWLFGITIDEERGAMARDELMARLGAVNIETRPFFMPVHHLPPYKGRTGSLRSLPVTDLLGATGMNLPTSSVMTDDDVDRVLETTLGILAAA